MGTHAYTRFSLRWIINVFVSGRSRDSLVCFLSKWYDSRSALLTDSHTSPPSTNHKWRQPRRLKNGPVLLKGLILNWRLASESLMSSQLTADNLFTALERSRVHRRWVSCLRTIDPCTDYWTNAYHCCEHWWPRLVRITSKQQDRFSFKTSTGLSADQVLCQDRSCIAPQTVFQLTWCFRKTLLLTHMFGTALAIEMAADIAELSVSPIGATTTTRTRSESSVIG